jgi:hypothetical protein
MILNQTEVDVTKSKQFETTEFRIDAKYKTKVLWMLINQYRHKVRTPIQEIVSNARDAQRENGNPDKPIKIQLPTRIEPTFIVRDFGVGMSPDRVKNIFTSFGASTKNADNSQTGGFGIGAKSPLAYTDSFNIKTYVDGTYWFYVVARNKEDGISINLLASGETDQENGTEVQIPVNPSDTRTFIKSACRSTMFWDVKPEFNLPDEDIYKVTGGTQISDSFFVYNSNELGGMFDSDLIAVIDGIPYELDYQTKRQVKHLENITNKLNYGSSAVLYLNTGDIDLLQTRESIDETERTLAELQKIGFKAFSDLELYLGSCLNAKGLHERIKQYKDLSNKFKRIGQHKFETFVLGSRYTYLNDKLDVMSYDFQGKTGRVTRPVKQTSWDNSLFNNYLNNVYWDDLGDKESDVQKNKRLRYFIESSDQDNVTVVRQGNATKFVYIRTLRMAGAKKLSSLELPPKAVKGKKGTYKRKPKTDKVAVHVMTVNSTGWRSWKVVREAKNIKLDENSTKFVYVGYHDYASEFEDRNWINLFKEQFNLVPCKLSESVIKKVKDDDNFITLEEFRAGFKPSQDMINQVVNDHINGAYCGTKDDVKFICKNITRIEDKRLTRIAQYVNLNKDIELPRDLKASIQNDNAKRLRVLKKVKAYIEERLLDRYPLLRNSNVDASIKYINAIHRSM